MEMLYIKQASQLLAKGRRVVKECAPPPGIRNRPTTDFKHTGKQSQMQFQDSQMQFVDYESLTMCCNQLVSLMDFNHIHICSIILFYSYFSFLFLVNVVSIM